MTPIMFSGYYDDFVDSFPHHHEHLSRHHQTPSQGKTAVAYNNNYPVKPFFINKPLFLQLRTNKYYSIFKSLYHYGVLQIKLENNKY